MTNRRASEGLFTQMVTSILAIGRMTNQMERVPTSISMERTMRVIGSMISIMVWARNSGPTELFTKASTVMERSMVRGASSGKMEAVSLDNSEIIVWKV